MAVVKADIQEIAAIIDMRNIVKTYRLKKSRKRFPALDNVSLSVKKGEIFGLLGSNGAGKTTFIKIMAGLLEPDEGSGEVLGYNIYRDHKKIRSKVSLVAPTADVGTDNNLTVRQNLEFWAVVYNLERERRKSRIDEMLDFLKLREFENHWPMSISAGNRQKLAIARSLLVKNPIVFLDEPTVKLDAAGAEDVRKLVKRINQEFGITVILCTHYIFEAEELCERVAIMHRGKILSCDTVANLRRNLQRYDELLIACRAINEENIIEIKELPFVVDCEFDGSSLTVRMESMHERLLDLLSVLRKQGVQILEITANEPTLEDIYMDAIGGGL